MFHNIGSKLPSKVSPLFNHPKQTILYIESLECHTLVCSHKGTNWKLERALEMFAQVCSIQAYTVVNTFEDYLLLGNLFNWNSLVWLIDKVS